MPGLAFLVAGARRLALPVALAVAATAPSSSLAAGGVPDSSFGTGGIASVSAAVPGAREFGNAMVVDSQDRVLVGGGVLAKEPTEPSGGWVLTRFRSDGSVDRSFGQDGVAKEAPGLFGPGLAEFGQEIRALAIEPGTGKIIAGGMTVNPAHFALFTIARYDTDGSLDTSFGPADTGFVTAEITASGANLEDIAVGADGSITPVGSSGLSVALARWDSDGNPDPSFDGPGGTGNGAFTDLIAGTFDDLRDVAVEPSGAVRAVGVASGANGEWLIVRYSPTGARETTFNGTGAVVKGFGNGSDLGGGQVLVGDTLYVFGSIDVVPGNKTERDFGVDAFDATTGAEIPGTATRVRLPKTQNLLGAGLQRIGGSPDLPPSASCWSGPEPPWPGCDEWGAAPHSSPTRNSATTGSWRRRAKPATGPTSPPTAGTGSWSGASSACSKQPTSRLRATSTWRLPRPTRRRR